MCQLSPANYPARLIRLPARARDSRSRSSSVSPNSKPPPRFPSSFLLVAAESFPCRENICIIFPLHLAHSVVHEENIVARITLELYLCLQRFCETALYWNYGINNCKSGKFARNKLFFGSVRFPQRYERTRNSKIAFTGILFNLTRLLVNSNNSG